MGRKRKAPLPDHLLKARLTAYLRNAEDKQVLRRDDVARGLASWFPEYAADTAQLTSSLDDVFGQIAQEEESAFGGGSQLDEILMNETTGEYELASGLCLDAHWLDRLVVPADVCAACAYSDHRELDCPVLREEGEAIAACEYCDEYGHVVRACPEMHNLCHKCLCRGHWHEECESRDEAKWQTLKTEGVLSASDKFTYKVDKHSIAGEIKLRLNPYGTCTALFYQTHLEAMPAYLWAWLGPPPQAPVFTTAEEAAAGLSRKRKQQLRRLRLSEWGANPVRAKTGGHCRLCLAEDHGQGHAVGGECPVKTEQGGDVRCGYCDKTSHFVSACPAFHSVCLVCLRRGHASGRCSEDDNAERWSNANCAAAVANGGLKYGVSRAEFVRDLKQLLGNDAQWLITKMPSFIQNWFLREKELERAVSEAVAAEDVSVEVVSMEAVSTEEGEGNLSTHHDEDVSYVAKVLSDHPHWYAGICFKHCSYCGSPEHKSKHCPAELDAAECEYCNDKDHRVAACPFMHGLCMACLLRGHQTGGCASADKAKWKRLKTKGVLSRFPSFQYQVRKRAVLQEVFAAFGEDLEPGWLPELIQQWLHEYYEARRTAQAKIDAKAASEARDKNVGTDSGVQSPPTASKAEDGASRILAAHPHWHVGLGVEHCCYCGSSEHDSTHCPVDLVTAECDFCAAKGHLVAACQLMHWLCMVCLRRGHQTGNCAAADKAKWKKWKKKGVLSKFPSYHYELQKKAILTEVRAAFGPNLEVGRLPEHIQEWLQEPASKKPAKKKEKTSEAKSAALDKSKEIVNLDSCGQAVMVVPSKEECPSTASNKTQEYKILADHPHWHAGIIYRHCAVCSRCGSSEHITKHCSLDLATAECEYCAAKGHHLVAVCQIMHRLCLVCLNRGHQTGKCSEEDKSKWERLKDKGALSKFSSFNYTVQKEAILKEVREAFGPDLEPSHLPKHIQQWLKEECEGKSVDQADKDTRAKSAPKDSDVTMASEECPSQTSSTTIDGSRILAANPHWHMSLDSNCCSCCGSSEHQLDSCPMDPDTAECEYCAAKGHWVRACQIMQGLCLVCMHRGHETGNCTKADKAKWRRLKKKGVLSQSKSFHYFVNKTAILEEVRAAFGTDLEPDHLPKRIQQWLQEENVLKQAIQADKEATGKSISSGNSPSTASGDKSPSTGSNAVIVLPKIPADHPNWHSSLDPSLCSCCASSEHQSDSCPIDMATADCEYCMAKGHSIAACKIMQGLCTVCLCRGHETGSCAEADKAKWMRLKTKGVLSQFKSFHYHVIKTIVLREVRAALGAGLEASQLPKHIHQWLREDAKKAKKREKKKKRKMKAAIDSTGDDVLDRASVGDANADFEQDDCSSSLGDAVLQDDRSSLGDAVMDCIEDY